MSGWVAPVGCERRAIAWQSAAERIGFVSDPHAERMTSVRGGVTIEIATRQSDGDFWLVATLGYASLGLDLDLTRRKWTDRVALNLVKSGVPELDEHLAAHAREHAQAQAALTPALHTTVAAFEEIQVGDRAATLARRGSAHSFDTLTAFVHDTVDVAKEFEAAAALVPAPAVFAADVPAWRAVIGIDRVTVGTDWTRSGQLLGTRLRVAIDPPLAAVPVTPDDPALSPAARNARRALLEAARGVRLEPDALRVEIDGKLADPAAALSNLELARGAPPRAVGHRGRRPVPLSSERLRSIPVSPGSARPTFTSAAFAPRGTGPTEAAPWVTRSSTLRISRSRVATRTVSSLRCPTGACSTWPGRSAGTRTLAS